MRLILEEPQSHLALQSADTRRTFREIHQSRLRSPMENMLDGVRSETSSTRIREGYRLVPTADGFEVANDSGIWAFREHDVRAHWAPFTTDKEIEDGAEPTPLTVWAQEHDIPVFLVARKIAREGTQGNYIFAKAWERYSPAMLEALNSAFGTWVQSYGTATH